MTYDPVKAESGWTMFRVGQGILLDGEQVLLSGNRWYADKPLVWTLPGGRAEEGEGLAEALVREFREETGLEIEMGELAYVAESRSSVQRRLFLVCVFMVRRTGGTLDCSGDPGVEELRWVGRDELDAYLPSPSLGEPLRTYLSGVEGGGRAPARYWFFPEYLG